MFAQPVHVTVTTDESLSPWCPCLRRRTIDGCLS